jgi:hypothetical protein
VRNSTVFIFIVFVLAQFAFGQRNPTLIESKRALSRTLETSGAEKPNTEPNAEVLNASVTDSPLKILKKPRAAYASQDHGSVCVQGTVRLRVEFLANGTIGRIFPVTHLFHGLTENSIDAARNIKFEPATKDGKPVSVFKVVEYSFSLY